MELSKEQQRYQQIINEAWENESFKQELIADPVTAIEKLTGEKVNLPEGKTLVVQDQAAEDKIFINIPNKIRLDNTELTEEQLEEVAGGSNFFDAVRDFINHT